MCSVVSQTLHATYTPYKEKVVRSLMRRNIELFPVQNLVKMVGDHWPNLCTDRAVDSVNVASEAINHFMHELWKRLHEK